MIIDWLLIISMMYVFIALLLEQFYKLESLKFLLLPLISIVDIVDIFVTFFEKRKIKKELKNPENIESEVWESL